MFSVGETITFVEATDEQVRWGNNDDPRDYLILGNLYIIADLDVRSWHTKIILDEFSELRFNSVHFQSFVEGE